MKLAPQISFKNVPETEALVNAILERVERLDHFFSRITGCQVLIEAPHRKHQKGNQYRVRINVTVPGKEIVVTRNPHENKTHKDAYVAIRDAFNAVDRRLQDFAREVRRQVKVHQPQLHGRITRIFPKDGYGFLQTDSGEEVYFHEHSVINKPFASLETGQEVRLVEEMGDKGPQASTVEVLKGSIQRKHVPEYLLQDTGS